MTHDLCSQTFSALSAKEQVKAYGIALDLLMVGSCIAQATAAIASDQPLCRDAFAEQDASPDDVIRVVSVNVVLPRFAWIVTERD